MTKIEEIKRIMKALVIASPHDVGTVMAALGIWKAGASAENNSMKRLRYLADLGKLERGKGYFRVPGCKSEFNEHARLLTKCIGQILSLPPAFESVIHREHPLPDDVGLRPDALVFVKKGSHGLCVYLEAVNQEREPSIRNKRTKLESWPGATQYLSRLFGRPIPHFDFLTSDELPVYIKEVILNEN